MINMENSNNVQNTTNVGNEVLADVSTSLYGLYSIDNELMFVHKTREGAKKHQYEFEKEHGMGFYVASVIVLE